MPSTKADLRSYAFKRRDEVNAETRARFASRLADLGIDLVRELSPRPEPIVALYAPIGSEPDVLPLAVALRGAGISLCLPVDWSSGTALIYRRWTPGDPLAAGPLGIREPLESAGQVDPDVLFAPMAAFDRRGHRLGYGAGNVDQTLTALRAWKSVTAFGVAFALQEVEEVPVEPHDEPLDYVITESDIIRCRD